MSHRHPGHANPLMLVILGVPALMILGALKACDAATNAIGEIAAPSTARSPPPRLLEEPRYRIEIPEGWRI